MAQRIVQVDAFTDRPFHGNPAAVCVLPHDAPWDEPWMRRLAAEMNLSETAFLRRRPDRDWDLRWFTPAVEVDLCGHATLAAAHVLWEHGHADTPVVRFHTRSGVLSARRAGDGITMDFPARPAVPAEPPDGLLEALGLAAVRATARNDDDWLVEVANAADVHHVRPDFARLAAVDTRGVMVTARADDAVHDFVSRWFGPRVGVDEDPVTGSAHCCLGPWWAGRLGRAELNGYQASARGGSVRVRMNGERVELSGRAVTVLHGELADTARPQHPDNESEARGG